MVVVGDGAYLNLPYLGKQDSVSQYVGEKARFEGGGWEAVRWSIATEHPHTALQTSSCQQ